MCENLNTSHVRCDVCRTINLAKHVKPNPDMQMYDKCSPAEKIDCVRCTREEQTFNAEIHMLVACTMACLYLAQWRMPLSCTMTCLFLTQ